jgi:hypothetical protein
MKYNEESIVSCGIKNYSLKTFAWKLINACTGQPMSFIDTDKFVTCPHTECNCDIQWNYEKYKI